MRYHLKKLNLGYLISINKKILMYLSNNYLKKGRKYRFAVDYTDDPYYGNTDESNKNHVGRSKAKK